MEVREHVASVPSPSLFSVLKCPPFQCYPPTLTQLKCTMEKVWEWRLHYLFMQFNLHALVHVPKSPDLNCHTHRVSDVEKGIVILKKKVPGNPFLRLVVRLLA